jgi:hypothetical protein
MRKHKHCSGLIVGYGLYEEPGTQNPARMEKKDQLVVVGWMSKRPRDVSLRITSLLDFPPSRYRLERRTLTPDLTLLSLWVGCSI